MVFEDWEVMLIPSGDSDSCGEEVQMKTMFRARKSSTKCEADLVSLFIQAASITQRRGFMVAPRSISFLCSSEVVNGILLCNGLEVVVIAICHNTYFHKFILNLNGNLVCNMINLAF